MKWLREIRGWIGILLMVVLFPVTAVLGSATFLLYSLMALIFDVVVKEKDD